MRNRYTHDTICQDDDGTLYHQTCVAMHHSHIKVRTWYPFGWWRKGRHLMQRQPSGARTVRITDTCPLCDLCLLNSRLAEPSDHTGVPSLDDPARSRPQAAKEA